MKSKFPVTLALATALAAASAHAATISWTVNTIANDPTQVVNTGSLIAAGSGADGGTNANLVDNVVVGTVNGVSFTDAFTVDSPSHLDTLTSRVNVVTGAYYDILKFADRQGSGTATWSFSGLTVGQSYLFQVWYSDDNNNASTAGNSGLVLGASTYSSSPVTPVYNGAGTVTLLAQVPPGSLTTAPGQFGTGVFVADATSQILIGRAYTNLNTTPATASNVTINAYQLRAIPEPSAVLLGGLGLLALLRRRRD